MIARLMVGSSLGRSSPESPRSKRLIDTGSDSRHRCAFISQFLLERKPQNEKICLELTTSSRCASTSDAGILLYFSRSSRNAVVGRCFERGG